MSKDIICWWSGGITSAVACKLTIDLFGKDRCRVIMMDTRNEHEDTYRFRTDCSFWYGLDIEVISALGGGQYSKKKFKDFETIQDIWYHYESLNVATGAICSSELKRDLRKEFNKHNTYSHQVFGFEFNKSEMNRALSMKLYHEPTKPIFPLLMFALTKQDCINMVQDAGIKIPEPYSLGLHNNNCFNTGCVQGGIGYWQKIRDEFPGKFDAMAKVEHDLTDLRGYPVTMLKDQRKDTKEKLKDDPKSNLVFLKRHPDYPNNKELADLRRQEVKPLMECNGFCGTNVANGKNETINEINFEE